MTNNTTINEKIQGVMAKYLQTASERVAQVCKRHGIPERIGQAIMQDVADMHQDTITGLRLSYDDIALLNERTDIKEWNGTNLKTLFYVMGVYGQTYRLYDYVKNVQPDWKEDDTKPTQELKINGEVVYQIRTEALFEHYRRNGGKTPIEAAMLRDRAAIYRHSWLTCVLYSFVEDGKLTAEDVEQVAPQGCSAIITHTMRNMNTDTIIGFYRNGKISITDSQKERFIQQGIFSREDIANIDEELRKKQKERISIQGSNHIINTLQNTADLLSKSINTADMDAYGQPMELRPMLKAIEDKRTAALQIIEEKKQRNIELTEQEKAAACVPTMTYITQALRGAVVIANTWKPIADGKEKATYSGTLLEITKAVTGQEKPAQTQIAETWQALRFLSTQQLEFTEYVIAKRQHKRRGRPSKAAEQQAPTDEALQASAIPAELEIDIKGKKIRYEAVKVLTNPLTATFRHKLQDGETFSGSTEVTLDIHHIITEGRSKEKITLQNGKVAYIKKPVEHLTTLQQIYAWNTPAELRFYGAILSKSHIKEDELLKEINDYDSRMLLCIEADKAEADKQACSTSQEAEEQTQPKQTHEAKERRYRQKHKGRDREALQDMFIKAKEIGLIAWYSRTEAAASTGKKPQYVWKWGRPESVIK